MTPEEYYAECISIAADDCGLSLTPEQIAFLGDAVAGGAANFSMAFGHEVASANLTARETREREEIQQRLHYEQTVSRKRCNTCKGHGFTVDGWGRDFGCSDCGGKGSTPEWPFKFTPAASGGAR